LVDGERLAAALAEVAAWTPRRLPIGGADAQAVGISPGPEMGAALRAVERWWEERDFVPDRAACLAKLRELAERRF
jgi:poly(A) polymerase